jgi:hypothetical protein
MDARSIHFHGVDAWMMDVEWIVSLGSNRVPKGTRWSDARINPHEKHSRFWRNRGIKKEGAAQQLNRSVVIFVCLYVVHDENYFQKQDTNKI